MQFAARGVVTVVALSQIPPTYPRSMSLSDPSAIVVDLDCRYSSNSSISATFADIAKYSPPVDFLKIDSTLRGNIPGIIAAAQEHFGPTCVCVATPWHGRTVAGQTTYVGRVPLRETEFSHDSAFDPPDAPIRNEVFLSQTNRFLEAQSFRDLQTHVEDYANDFLLSGSSGFCAAVAEKNFTWRASDIELPKPLDRKLLIIRGSQTELTHSQLAECEVRNAAFSVFEPATPIRSKDELRDFADNAADHVRKGGYQAMLIIGGATSRSFLESMGAETIKALGTAPPFIPCGEVGIGGRELTTFFKGGNSGGVTSIVEFLSWFAA